MKYQKLYVVFVVCAIHAGLIGWLPQWDAPTTEIRMLETPLFVESVALLPEQAVTPKGAHTAPAQNAAVQEASVSDPVVTTSRAQAPAPTAEVKSAAIGKVNPVPVDCSAAKGLKLVTQRAARTAHVAIAVQRSAAGVTAVRVLKSTGDAALDDEIEYKVKKQLVFHALAPQCDGIEVKMTVGIEGSD